MCCACILHRKYLYRVDRERRPRTNAILINNNYIREHTFENNDKRASRSCAKFIQPSWRVTHSYFEAEINKCCRCARQAHVPRFTLIFPFTWRLSRNNAVIFLIQFFAKPGERKTAQRISNSLALVNNGKCARSVGTPGLGNLLHLICEQEHSLGHQSGTNF